MSVFDDLKTIYPDLDHIVWDGKIIYMVFKPSKDYVKGTRIYDSDCVMEAGEFKNGSRIKNLLEKLEDTLEKF